MKAKIHITLKNGVLDPQGAAIESTLTHMGFGGVQARVGKYIELVVPESNPDSARAAVTEMCEKLLANTVVEKYTFELVE